MIRMTGYRSLVIFAVVAATLACTGCGAGEKRHQTAKEAGTANWNKARLAIIYQLAETQYKVGDYDKCVETLREAFATHAPFAPMYILAARVDIERGSLESASNQLNAAIRINPSDPEPYYLLGVLHQRWQKPEAACDYYKQAWSKKIDEARYMLAVVEMEISLGQLDEAQSTLESKIVYFEQSAAVRIALARIASLKNDYPTACKYYRDAVTLTPEDKNLRRAYAEALFYAGQYESATPMLEEFRKRADNADAVNVVMMLGQCYLNMRRVQDARNCFQEVIREQPNDTIAYINLGKACLQTGELGLSLSAARKVLRLEPDNLQGMIIIALVQQKQGKWSDAAATLAKASRIAPNDTTILCMLGINSQHQGNRQEAVAFYEKAAQVNPRDPWAAELLGRPLPTKDENISAPESPETSQPQPAPAPAAAAPADAPQTAAISPVPAAH